MEMTQDMKDALKASDNFKTMVSAALQTVANTVINEDAGTANHVNRFALAEHLLVFGYNWQSCIEDNIINNQGITFDLTRDAYNTAVTAEWDNLANELYSKALTSSPS